MVEMVQSGVDNNDELPPLFMTYVLSFCVPMLTMWNHLGVCQNR
jgi:hypothetical protein